VSRVPSLASFGILACAAVAAATVAELVMLPALLVVTDRLVRRFPPPWRDGLFLRLPNERASDGPTLPEPDDHAVAPANGVAG